MSMSSVERDVIVIGGGAAGLFCAIEAGKRGRSTLVLEHNDRVGKKIAISGGGRCNFTNLLTSADNFLSANPNFAKSALARYTPQDFIALVERHGIRYHEKKLGQLFCDESSRQITGMLLAECDAAGVEIRLNCKVKGVSKDTLFRLETDQGEFRAASLVIATGGLSIAPTGATDFGYALARQFGLGIRETRPALVPLIFAPNRLEELKALSGVSIDALVSTNGARFRENVLLTHRGLSGPAILQISSYWKRGDAIEINLLPETSAREMLAARRQSDLDLSNLLSQHVPRRFAQAWCNLYAPSRPLSRYSNKELEEIARRLEEWRLVPDGTEGYKKAEVTAGGVDTDELSSRTMEARRVPGLYFIGEVVDVTGQLGGYNFQWAWASGYAAGQYA
jgi:predicted Rossmann fold flavoprotein